MEQLNIYIYKKYILEISFYTLYVLYFVVDGIVFFTLNVRAVS